VIVAVLCLTLTGLLGGASVPRRSSSALTLASVSNSNNNGNGSNNNSGGNGSFSLPSGLLTLALIGGLLFVVLLALIAGGVLALAVTTSRRLREINDTLSRMNPPPKGPAPPT